MSHETSRSNLELADAYRVLNNSVHDEKLLALTEETGPLQMSELDGDVRQSEAFREFVTEFDWPTVLEDGAITPSVRFKDDHDFLDAFKPLDDEREKGQPYLNNFKVWLSLEPSSELFNPDKMPDVYAAKPALHRAYVVAPEFMGSLRVAYNSLDRPRWSNYPDRESFESNESELVLRGAHLAYQLLGRLLKTTDPDLESMTLFGKHSDTRITDAMTELAK